MKKLLLIMLLISGVAHAGMFDEIGITQDEANKQFVRTCAQNRKAALKNLEQSVMYGFRDIWYSPKLSPQAHFAILAEKGAALFSDSYAIQTLIKQLDPTWKFLVPPYEYTIAENGVVTLGNKLETDPNPELTNVLR